MFGSIVSGLNRRISIASQPRRGTYRTAALIGAAFAALVLGTSTEALASPGCTAINSGAWQFGAAPGATAQKTGVFAAGDRVYFTFTSTGLGGTVSASGALSSLVGGVVGPYITFGTIATAGSGTLTLLGIATNGIPSPIVVSFRRCLICITRMHGH